MNRSYKIMVGILGVLFVGAAAWGITGQVQRHRYRNQLQSMYERSYYSFVSAMDELEVNLSKLMVSDAPEQDVLLLSKVTKLADETTRELSSMNSDQYSVSEVMSFVIRLGDYCQSLAQNTSDGRPISQTDRENLSFMLERQTEFNNMVKSIDVSRLSNVDVEPMEPNVEENPFYASIEPETEVPALIYDGPFSDAAIGEPKALGEEVIDQQIANSVALGFIGQERVSAVSEYSGMSETEIETFGVQVETLDAGTLFLQITKKGGQVLMMMPETSPKETNYTVEECRQSAEGFLYEHGFGLMEANYWQMYAGLITFNFNAIQDGIRLYPDLIKVQVSMETGLVIGFEAGNYLRNHVQRELPEPTVTQAQATALGKNMEVTNVRLCVIPMLGSEKFCYELSGKRGGDAYLIYINAETGKTENILKVLLEDDKEMVI